MESVQRVNRATDELSGHLLAVEGDLGAAGKLTVHAESLDYDAPARRALSSLTCGAEWSGARALGGGRLLWELEAAEQRGAGDNPRELDAGYLFASLGWGGATGRRAPAGSGSTATPGTASSTPRSRPSTSSTAGPTSSW